MSIIYMVKCINIITRIGSKQNDIKYFKHLLPVDVETVVEPFAGSFAVIKYFYTDINKYKFHINDIDKILYYMYIHFEDLINMKIRLSNLYDEICIANPKYIKEISFKPNVENMEMHDYLKQYVLDNMFIRGCKFKGVKGQNYNEAEKEILKHALITTVDFIEVLSKFHDDNIAFLFLDPPYLFSNNKTNIPQNE